MKKIFLLLQAIYFIPLQAQKYSNENEDRNYPSTNQLRYTIYSVEYKEGKTKIDNYIMNNHFFVVNQNETKDSHHYEFRVADYEIAKIDSFCNTLGYISSKNVNSYNNGGKLNETQLELERLETKKKEYEKMLARIDSVKSERYYQHWEKIREIDLEIYNARKRINQLQSVQNLYSVTIDLNDEQSSPTNSKINYVHMPGAEYAYLFTETPTPGISNAAYQGLFLKYLFTKGKSYFSLGALKAVNPSKADTAAYDELFCFSFGQDWYSRNFGRGSRKFLNLYIGYQGGYALSYSNRKAINTPFVSPGAGLEIFKNKYILFDTGVHYYLPLTANNRYTRGIRVSTSLNFNF